MAKKKINHDTSTQQTVLTKNWNTTQAVIDDSFIFFPGKKEWRERLIYTMEQYFNNPDHVVFEEFLREFKIPVSTFFYWVEKYPDLKKAYINIKENIAVERKIRTMNFKMHYQSAYRDMHKYDARWGTEVDEYHAKLRKDEENHSLEAFQEAAKHILRDYKK